MIDLSTQDEVSYQLIKKINKLEETLNTAQSLERVQATEMIRPKYKGERIAVINAKWRSSKAGDELQALHNQRKILMLEISVLNTILQAVVHETKQQTTQDVNSVMV